MDYNEIFGLTEAQPEGEEEQAVAEPDEDQIAEGAEERDVADPDPADEENDEQQDEAETQDAKKPGGKTEDDARYAAARRKAEAERDSAVQQAVQAERERINELIKRMGIRNPQKAGTNMESLDDFEAYDKALSQRQFQKRMKSGELSQEDIARSVMESEAMKPLQQLRQELEEQRNRERMESVRREIDRDVAAIAALDPDVTGMDDIRGQAEWPKIMEHVQRGESLYDAYRLVHMDKILSTGKAREANRNLQSSKDHLRPVKTRGAGDVEVTQAEVEAFRELMPDVSREEIRKFMQKDRKTLRK